MKVGSVGISENTIHKQKCLYDILNIKMMINYRIFKKYQKEDWFQKIYWHFDITAGTGIVNGKMGSPIVFLNLVKKYKYLDFVSIFIEENKNSIIKLKENISKYHYQDNNTILCINGDNADILLRYCKKRSSDIFGSLYIDPNGNINGTSIDTLIEFSRNYPRLDFIMHINPSMGKRTRGLPQNYNIDRRIYSEIILQIDKTHWLIREPFKGKWQQTFLIGSNWSSFPDFKKIGFYSVDDKRGKEILDFVDLTVLQFKKKYKRKFIYNNNWVEKLNRKEIKKVCIECGNGVIHIKKRELCKRCYQLWRYNENKLWGNK